MQYDTQAQLPKNIISGKFHPELKHQNFLITKFVLYDKLVTSVRKNTVPSIFLNVL